MLNSYPFFIIYSVILQKKIKKGVFVNDSMKITNIYQIKKLFNTSTRESSKDK